MSTMFKMFVGNVAFTVTEDQLRKLFEPHLPIEDVIIARDGEGKSRGFGFVLTRDHEAGKKAIIRLGKIEMDGRRMYLKEAGDKTPPRGGRRGGGGRPQRGGRRPFRSRPPRRDVARQPSEASTASKPLSNPTSAPPTPASPPPQIGGGYEGMNSD
ncbi:MAG: hypothetical protein GC159_20165 [Phycisphaera sp.]|nr:hypothetical protein [Phycisphaera sp.]